MATINGYGVVFGCAVEGNRGIFALDYLADVAEGFGWPGADTDDDPRYWRDVFDRALDDDDQRRADDAYDRLVDSADEIERWLNDHAEGCRVLWYDGECFIEATEVADRFDFERGWLTGEPSAVCRGCGARFFAYEVEDLEYHDCWD